MLPKRAFRISGFAFLLIGFVFLVNTFKGITGFSIIGDVDSSMTGIAGIWFIISGIALLVLVGANTKNSLELKVFEVYGTKDKDPERTYCLDDRIGEFGKGQITLKKFKDTIMEYQAETDGEELVEIVRKSYKPELEKIFKDGNETQRKVAAAFLKVLGVEVVAQKEKPYKLEKGDRAEIIDAFRTYEGHGKLNGKQREILDKYDLVLTQDTGKHIYKIVDPKTGKTSPLASSPSDFRAGLNKAHQMAKFIEEIVNERRNKK